MNYKIQLLSFLFSFLYGVFFYFTSLLNYKFIKKLNKIFQYAITFAYMLNIAIIYICLSFKINNGNIHHYFIFMVLIGFAAGHKFKKVLKKNVKFYESVVRRKN